MASSSPDFPDFSSPIFFMPVYKILGLSVNFTVSGVPNLTNKQGLANSKLEVSIVEQNEIGHQ
jgi:hypothetical protein